MSSTLRSLSLAAVFGAVAVASFAADHKVAGSYTSDLEINATEDSTVRLNGVSFHDCQLKLTGNVTFTLELAEGTTNDFSIVNSKCAAIKATRQSNLIIDGTGKLKITAEKRMLDDGGVVVCSNLTIRGGSTSVTFDKDKSDSPCILVKGNYLQTGGKLSLDLHKKNVTNEFYGIQFYTKNTTFTMEGGEISASVAGTKSRAIDLKKSCTATFNGGDCTAYFEGPQGRFVSGGTIAINGGSFNFTTNITSKMTAEYYPTYISAIKADYSVTVTGGDFEADLPLEGSEVITNDSETGTDVTISGGDFDLVAGNDCIHSQGNIIINAGNIRAVSAGDDAIDANERMTISGGNIRAYAVSTDTHGLDVNKGETLTITGGIVIATDGPDTHRIGSGESDVGKKDFKQATYYGTIPSSGYSQRYLVLEAETNNVAFTIKPCLPALSAGNFNLLVSVPGRDGSKPQAKTLQEAYADASTRCPLVFEKKVRIEKDESGVYSLTTKEGAVLNFPFYYKLKPKSGKTKTVTLNLDDEASSEITSITAGGAVEVKCSTIYGLNYQLMRAANLDSGLWTACSSVVKGNGGEMSIQESSAAKGSAQFYKVETSD